MTTQDTLADELLPCPFCGGKAELLTPDGVDEIYLVTCDNSECHVYAHATGDTANDAIGLWNLRQQPTLSQVEEVFNDILRNAVVLDEEGGTMWSETDLLQFAHKRLVTLFQAEQAGGQQ